MKKITLKTVPIMIGENEQSFNYFTQIKYILENPSTPEVGATVSEIRQSVRVLDKIEAQVQKDKPEYQIELEDADYDYLKQRVAGAHYSMNNKALLDFIDGICNLKE